MKTKYFNLIKEIPDKELIISLYFTQIVTINDCLYFRYIFI